MNREKLEIAQMIQEHPIKNKKEQFRIDYINVLEYFVRKYSNDDKWANATLKLYKSELLNDESAYKYLCQDTQSLSRSILAAKFKRFRFFSYRFCMIMDCIFINSINDRQKADKIFNELILLYKKRYRKKIVCFYETLFNSELDISVSDKTRYMRECWKQNVDYLNRDVKRILITANMSAGKSTLLNALIGKKVNRTQNDSCTSKVHYLLNKPFEDGFEYEWDFELELNADYQTLMDDNENNDSTDITVGCFFRSPIKSEKWRTWFIDTPGVNSSHDEDHSKITEKAITTIDSDVLLYLVNGENIGTDDDKKHLQFVQKNYKGSILFVVNKVDRFRKNQDSVLETIQGIVKDLEKIGFKSPTVVPVSSYAGYLAKMKIYGDKLNEDEQDEFELLSRKLSREEYQFDSYYPNDIQEKANIDKTSNEYMLLKHSGILHLEAILYKN